MVTVWSAICVIAIAIFMVSVIIAVSEDRRKWGTDRQIQEHIKLLHKPKNLIINFQLQKGMSMGKTYEVGDKLECTRSKDLTVYRIASIVLAKDGDVFILQSVGSGLITKALMKSTILSEYRRSNG